VTGAAGVAVGLLRRVTQLPEKTPGIIAELQEEFVDPAWWREPWWSLPPR
jgi:hypothetical protein